MDLVVSGAGSGSGSAGMLLLQKKGILELLLSQLLFDAFCS